MTIKTAFAGMERKSNKQGRGAKYLRAHEPTAVVFTEPQPNRSKACRREYEIKGYPKQKKEALIS